MASAVAASHQRPAVAASVMARVDRLDLLVGHLEGMRGGNGSGRRSCGGSPSTTTATVSDSGSSSSVASTPRGMGCRPAKEALEEARAKGSLVDRIAFLESRVIKMEEEMEVTSDVRTSSGSDEKQQRRGKNAEKGKRFKSLIKSCVTGRLEAND